MNEFEVTWEAEHMITVKAINKEEAIEIAREYAEDAASHVYITDGPFVEETYSEDGT